MTDLFYATEVGPSILGATKSVWRIMLRSQSENREIDSDKDTDRETLMCYLYRILKPL